MIGWLKMGFMSIVSSSSFSAMSSRASVFHSWVKHKLPKQKEGLVIQHKGLRGYYQRFNRWLRNLSGWKKAIGYWFLFPGSIPATVYIFTEIWEFLVQAFDWIAEKVIQEAQKQQSEKVKKSILKDRDKLIRKLKKFPTQIGHPFVRDLARLTPHRGRGFVRRNDGSFWYSGRAAANWVVRPTLGAINWIVPPSPNREEMVKMTADKAKRQLQYMAKNADWSGRKFIFYISNPVHYISYLRKGSSKQAKAGYVTRIVAAHQRRLARLYEKHFAYYEKEEIEPNEYLEAIEATKKAEKTVEQIKQIEKVVDVIKVIE